MAKCGNCGSQVDDDCPVCIYCGSDTSKVWITPVPAGKAEPQPQDDGMLSVLKRWANRKSA